MINKVILVGNLGKDPDIKTTPAGVMVAQFSMATTEWYMDKDNVMQSKTEWHNIVAWRHLAEKAQKNLKKGSKVYLEGKITTRKYEKEGVTHYITEIVANLLMSLDKKEGGTPSSESEYHHNERTHTATSHVTQAKPVDIEEEAGDDLPF